ncbi:MAG: hydroxymethylglutaryl-CoA reductase [Verrucomicrobia bacterium]|nr:hydroxymethylglutaryl-CoA reductase [Verrucomicrobiota bacterium]MBU1908513.1 hydroxymethylglutaryl-CoA reductase [Verrucomicrobiota bacterium]
MSSEKTMDSAAIPLRWVGPIRLAGPEVTGEVQVPLATFETPLWPSVERGARVSMATEGLRAVVVDERMTRSVLVEAPDAAEAVRAGAELLRRKPEIAARVEATSRFLKFLDIHIQCAANLLYVRLEAHPGDASGHNMLTRAAEAMLDWILREYSALKYVSISGNYCTDKKPSAVNGILGRGRHVIAELNVPREVCEKMLKTTPEKIADLNIKKNLIGTMLAGGLRSANAHFANMLLAFYLATGQDAANIVEGSQGLTHAEARDGALYFSVSVPHLIVGTVGSGKDLDFVRANLERLGCLGGGGARRLAVLCAAAVLCGELSLLAAQTNPGELMRAHLKLERRGKVST